jgi:hypothetical protein
MSEQQRQYFHSGLIGDCLEYKRFVHCISSFQDIIDLVIAKSIISNTFNLVNTKLKVFFHFYDFFTQAFPLCAGARFFHTKK